MLISREMRQPSLSIIVTDIFCFLSTFSVSSMTLWIYTCDFWVLIWDTVYMCFLYFMWNKCLVFHYTCYIWSFSKIIYSQFVLRLYGFYVNLKNPISHSLPPWAALGPRLQPCWVSVSFYLLHARVVTLFYAHCPWF